MEFNKKNRCGNGQALLSPFAFHTVNTDTFTGLQPPSTVLIRRGGSEQVASLSLSQENTGDR
ncbi:MAG: hypothetical protein Q8O95_00730 [bacterium]|nr:hypothetical protein [bacterium]